MKQNEYGLRHTRFEYLTTKKDCTCNLNSAVTNSIEFKTKKHFKIVESTHAISVQHSTHHVDAGKNAERTNIFLASTQSRGQTFQVHQLTISGQCFQEPNKPKGKDPETYKRKLFYNSPTTTRKHHNAHLAEAPDIASTRSRHRIRNLILCHPRLLLLRNPQTRTRTMFYCCCAEPDSATTNTS